MTASTLRVTGLRVGGRAWLEHLGVTSPRPQTTIAWDDVVRIEGERIVVRDEASG